MVCDIDTDMIYYIKRVYKVVKARFKIVVITNNMTG